MSASISRTRTAVLCFGGWGLQTMLHLWPRLRLIQEAREVLGFDGKLPNLDRLIAFAAILPEPMSTARSMPTVPFRVFQPTPDRYPGPLYLANQLASIEAVAAGESGADLTRAEQVGARLLQRAQGDGFVQPLSVALSGLTERAMSEMPVSRAGMFRAGIGAAGMTVRTLLSQVIDPTRLDSMQPRDPFVQTTIYVVASLSEPLASALVWPIVSEVVEALRRRQVARIVAFLSTASFAPDDERVVEEATVHMALRELEALTGSGCGDTDSHVLTRLIAESGGRAWEERVGSRLFDMTYLVDREKSNQSLAASAYELSVLVGNTIEAFLVADGLGHLEQSLGPDAATHRPFYSVLGAAIAHTPLAEYLAVAIEEEEKQAIRSTVLTPAEPAPEALLALPATDLQDLGATPDRLVRAFLDASGAPIFERMASQREAGGLLELQVAKGAVLPEGSVRDLRRTRDPVRWRQLLDRCVAEAAAAVEEACGAAQAAWGLPSETQHSSAHDVPATSDSRGELAHAAVGHGRAGLIPDAVDLAAEQIVTEICRAPGGILHARARLAGWRQAVSRQLRDLERDAEATAQSHEHQSKLDAWGREFAQEAYRHGRNRAPWVAVLVLASFGALVCAGVWLLQRATGFGNEGWGAILAGAALALTAAVVAGWYSLGGRMGRLKRQGMRLAQEQTSQLASELLRRGLFRAYSRLYEELQRLETSVDRALVQISDWARAEASPHAGTVHIRVAPADKELWKRVQEHVRHSSANGEITCKRFRELWESDGSSSQGWSSGGGRLVRLVRAALDRRHGALDDASLLAQAFREYAMLASQYLCPTHRLFADHPSLVQEASEHHRVERLLSGEQGHAPSGAGDRSGADVIEDLYARAKPCAGFEITYLLSSDVLEVEFGVAAEGLASPMQRAFEQRGMPLLASEDPLTLSVVRTVNRLSRAELILTERCRAEYLRLSSSAGTMLSLLSPDEGDEADMLYGEGLPLRQTAGPELSLRNPA